MLRELEEALVALVTDGALGALYAHSPAEAIAAACASEPARRMLEALRPADLLRYAEGLRRKRWDEVCPLVPLTARVTSRLGARYRAWLSTHPARAEETRLSPGAAEALRALPALYEGLRADPGEAAWTADLLAFEVLRACSRGDGVRRGFRSEYAAHVLAAEVQAGIIPVDPEAAPHEYAFTRAGVRHRSCG